MIPMAVRLIFAQFAFFLLSVNLALTQMQNHGGGQTHHFQHSYAFGNSYAYKWEVPFTYTYTIPPFTVDGNQYKADVAQAQHQQTAGSNPNYSAVSSTQQQQQPSVQNRFGNDQTNFWENQWNQQRTTQQPLLQNRFGNENQANVWQNQNTQQQQQQQQPSLQSRFEDEDDQQITTAQPQQSAPEENQTEFVRVPIFDNDGRQIGWKFSEAAQQNNPQNSVAGGSGFGGGIGGGQIPQSTEPPQSVQTTQIFTTRPPSNIQRRNPILPPPASRPIQSSINQMQQTELSQQPTMFYNTPLGQQTAGGASGAAVPSKMCTAQQISSNLCPGAHPSVSGVNFFTGQQSQDIDRLLQSLQSSVHQNAQLYPTFPSGDLPKPAVVVGSSVSGGPGGGVLSYAFTKA